MFALFLQIYWVTSAYMLFSLFTKQKLILLLKVIYIINDGIQLR